LEEKAKPVTDDLDEGAVAGSESEYPNIHPDPSTCDDAQEAEEQCRII
jgi:hypothetical protein